MLEPLEPPDRASPKSCAVSCSWSTATLTCPNTFDSWTGASTIKVIHAGVCGPAAARIDAEANIGRLQTYIGSMTTRVAHRSSHSGAMPPPT